MPNNPTWSKSKASRSANQKKRSEELSFWLAKHPPCRVKAGPVKFYVGRHGAELCTPCDPHICIMWSVSHLYSEQENGFLTSKKKKKNQYSLSSNLSPTIACFLPTSPFLVRWGSWPPYLWLTLQHSPLHKVFQHVLFSCILSQQ